jgi:uncharacterized DUF497 family protein
MVDLVSGFDWDAGNRDKCRKHGLSLTQIEAVLRRPIAIHPAGLGRAEDRFIAIGITGDGRHVLIIFTLRAKFGSLLIRPISGRYMHLREVAHYEKASKTENGQGG